MAEIRGSYSNIDVNTLYPDLHEADACQQWEALYFSDNKTNSKPVLKLQIIFANNQGAIKLLENPRFYNWSKHIDIKYHFIREACQQGLIKLVYIPTADIVADILTKSLPREKHEKHMRGMGMCEWGQV